MLKWFRLCDRTYVWTRSKLFGKLARHVILKPASGCILCLWTNEKQLFIEIRAICEYKKSNLVDRGYDVIIAYQLTSFS